MRKELKMQRPNMALTKKLDNIKWVSHFLETTTVEREETGRKRREEKRKGKIQKGMEL